MPKYRIQQALKHDGDSYAEGDSIKMPKAEAQELVDAGVLAESQPEISRQDSTNKPEDTSALHAIIRTVVEELMDREDAALWTQSGKAKTEAIEAVLGFAVSASERDAAMAEA